MHLRGIREEAPHNHALHIMQSIFSVAARCRNYLGNTEKAERRAGALKMDWTEPLHDAGPMCIEWFAGGRRRRNRPGKDDGLAADMR
jgi:hypothetical protein